MLESGGINCQTCMLLQYTGNLVRKEGLANRNDQTTGMNYCV